MNAYRFVIFFRGEESNKTIDEQPWRGWVEQVFPIPTNRNARQFFSSPDDISQIIKEAVEYASD